MVARQFASAGIKPPNALKRFLDHDILPASIDAAGEAELILERFSASARERPILFLAGAFGLGWVLARIGRRPTRPLMEAQPVRYLPAPPPARHHRA
jgi:hypothetical protein